MNTRSPFKGKKFRKWLMDRLVQLEIEALRKRGIIVKLDGSKTDARTSA